MPILALLLIALSQTVPQRIVAAARDQVTWGTTYDPAYVRLAYPGGDVPRTKGVCTDVVIRALRAVGHDLQVLIHEDKKRRPAAYPRTPLDRNIDHRRVPSQMAFFRKHGRALSLDSDWLPGDIVCWRLPSGRDHIGIVMDRRGTTGDWTVVHNLSRPAEDDCLKSWTITGHFRYPR
ncbi:MAG TPA: DUF1287 domain-containing protein [Fimbriimonadaceae bacterium]|nr:DUF1287 domain-containing protein [Fimbriimonadaceae bacterium]